MKILVAAPDQIMTRVGGLRTQVERTVAEMRKLGVTVDYYNHWEDFNYSSYDLAHTFSMNSPCFFKSDVFKAMGLPQVISSVMWRTGRRSFIRLLVELGIRSPYMLLNDVICCRKMSEWSELVLPNTFAELTWLKESIGVDSNKCVVVPNGADAHFDIYSKEELYDNSTIKVDGDFVFCSSVVFSRKNLKVLGDVCLDNNYPLIIAGPIIDVSIKNYFDDLNKRGAKIRLLGKIDNNSFEMGYLYSACRVFCLPSLYETPGISALEAGLCGANIVVTKVGGAEEYFEGMARYVDPLNKTDIEEKLIDAWNNPPTAKQKITLADHIKSEFSWSSVASKTIKAYEKMLVNL